MEVLQLVWEMEEATVNDVRDVILEERDVAYTTIMTVMKNLADKGYLKYRKDGVTYVYSPAQPPEEVRFDLLEDVMSKVFQGSPTALVQALVQKQELSEEQRRELKNLIATLDDDDGEDR
jgi:predicted transcriptional regulator